MHPTKPLSPLLAVLLLTALPQMATAATWTVEKDGSGDFAIVQEAIDAAAPGDSILIGPGRYDDFYPQASTVDGSPFTSVAYIGKENLTVLGAGRDSTFLGPDPPLVMVDELYTGSLFIDGGGTGAILRGIQFDGTAAIATIRVQSFMEDCRVARTVPLVNSFGLTFLEASDVIIRATDFTGPDNILTGFGTSGLIVEDCTFHDETEVGYGVVIGNGAVNCIVRRCTFTRGSLGVQFGLGGTGVVEDCTVTGMADVGIDLSQGSAVVRRCRIGETRMCIRAGTGRIEVYDSVLEGGTFATIASTTDVLVQGSHILNAGAPSVWSRASVGEVLDLRENWWGTDDEAQVESWIDDENGTVLWSPISPKPIPTETQSMGGFKSRYGGSRDQ